MAKFFVNLDDETSEWLAAKIDDSKRTVRDVAHAILREAAQAQQELARARICNCGGLETTSAEENSPIIFDELVNEYHLLRDTHNGKARSIIRYCLWCGGRAPPLSKRAQLFAKVSYEEIRRLKELCGRIKSFQDAFDLLGAPDSDLNVGSITTRKTDEGAEEHTPHRVISYQNLSDTAEVRFTQKFGDLVSASFMGKYIGPLRDSA